MTHPIPIMSDPLGKYWAQPSREDILIDATHALMTKETFSQLKNYSFTLPTSDYPGKMWKGQYKEIWYLFWYGYSENGPNYCSCNHRCIEVV